MDLNGFIMSHYDLVNEVIRYGMADRQHDGKIITQNKADIQNKSNIGQIFPIDIIIRPKRHTDEMKAPKYSQQTK